MANEESASPTTRRGSEVQRELPGKRQRRALRAGDGLEVVEAAVLKAQRDARAAQAALPVHQPRLTLGLFLALVLALQLPLHAGRAMGPDAPGQAARQVRTMGVAHRLARRQRRCGVRASGASRNDLAGGRGDGRGARGARRRAAVRWVAHSGPPGP